MECSEERVLAYQLATAIEEEALKKVPGGFGIVIPTFVVTGDPLSFDLAKDGDG